MLLKGTWLAKLADLVLLGLFTMLLKGIWLAKLADMVLLGLVNMLLKGTWLAKLRSAPGSPWVGYNVVQGDMAC